MSHFKAEFETLIVPGFKPLVINDENKKESLGPNKKPEEHILELEFLDRTMLGMIKTRQNQLNDKGNYGFDKISW